MSRIFFCVEHFLLMIIISIILMSVLVTCGDGDQEQSDDTAESTSTSEESQDEDNDSDEETGDPMEGIEIKEVIESIRTGFSFSTSGVVDADGNETDAVL